jgi:hypothetical protein
MSDDGGVALKAFVAVDRGGVFGTLVADDAPDFFFNRW